MVQRCCVPLCGTKVGDTDFYGIKVRFHRMPTTVEKFYKWYEQITDNNRLRTALSNNSRVCSKHFNREDYFMKSQGNTALKKEALPKRFKWNVDNCDISAPRFSTQNDEVMATQEVLGKEKHIKISTLLDNTVVVEVGINSKENANNYDAAILPIPLDSLNFEDVLTFDLDLRIHQETQCCLEDDKWKTAVYRKNSIIQQLLNKISELEEEQKLMEHTIAELRAANKSFENQIRELSERNQQLEEIRKQRHIDSRAASLSVNSKDDGPSCEKKSKLSITEDIN